MKLGGHRLRRRHALMLTALVGAAFVAANPPDATAACVVATTGRVACAADTVTADTVNLDGARPISSDRQQAFDNGAAVSAVIQQGVAIGGSPFGLRRHRRALAASLARI